MCMKPLLLLWISILPLFVALDSHIHHIQPVAIEDPPLDTHPYRLHKKHECVHHKINQTKGKGHVNYDNHPTKSAIRKEGWLCLQFGGTRTNVRELCRYDRTMHCLNIV